jgi:hypothetical protein
LLSWPFQPDLNDARRIVAIPNPRRFKARMCLLSVCS